MRVLYIQPSWVPPPEDSRADRFFLLSEHLEGDILQPVWYEPEDIKREFGADAYPEYARGRFHYHWYLSFRRKGWRRRLGTLWFFLRKGWELHRRTRYDCIIAYSHMTPALIGLVLKFFTRAKLIVEIMTAPDLAYLYVHPRRTLADRVLRFVSNLSLYVSALGCDRLHLLYTTQVDRYPLLRRVPRSVFHDFVPISQIPQAEGDPEQVVLLVGAPWFLKGVDLVVEAFRKIADEFPDVTLRIQGFYPDRAQVDALVDGSPRIEIVKAELNPETLRRISRALLLVHPSRCDGLSRVLIEAMSAGVPVIASDAGGNAHCVRDGETGLVFHAGNADELRIRLRELLADGELRARLGRKGYETAHAEYSEQVYVDRFTQMVEATVRGKNERGQ